MLIIKRFTDSLRAAESRIGVGVEFVFIDHENLTSSLADSCGLLRQNQFSVILDLTWGGWSSLQGVAEVGVYRQILYCFD